MKVKAIQQIREFNRFYTNIIGVLDKHILESPYSLSEARILYELYHLEMCTARQIMQRVNIDEGYLSRILDQFINAGLLKKARSESDKRAYMLSLTPKGRSQFRKINDASAEAVHKMIDHLSERDLNDLLTKMKGIQNILSLPHENH